MNGKTLKASAYSNRPYININEQNGELEGGLFIDMFKVLAEYLHFDYKLVKSYNWFEFHANGTIGASLGDVCA